jgi:hypothetical protein
MIQHQGLDLGLGGHPADVGRSGMSLRNVAR